MRFNEQLYYEDLLQPVLRGGQPVCELPDLPDIRSRVAEQLSYLPQRHQLLDRHEAYTVGLEEGLHKRKSELLRIGRSGEARADR